MKRTILYGIVCLCFFMKTYGDNSGFVNIEKDVIQTISYLLDNDLEQANRKAIELKGNKLNSNEKKVVEALSSAIESYKELNLFYGFVEKENWSFELFKQSKIENVSSFQFVDVNQVIKYSTGNNHSSIYDLVNSGESTEFLSKRTSTIQQKTDEAIKVIDQFEGDLIDNLRALLFLEKVYAYKIAGALELEYYNQLDTHIKEYQRNSVEELTLAGMYWLEYTRIVEGQGEDSIWLKNSSLSELKAIYRKVLDDIILAKSSI